MALWSLPRPAWCEETKSSSSGVRPQGFPVHLHRPEQQEKSAVGLGTGGQGRHMAWAAVWAALEAEYLPYALPYVSTKWTK